MALVSTTGPSAKMCKVLTRNGLMRYTGDAFNSRWEWELDKLDRLPEEELERMYQNFRRIVFDA